jgi:Protein of unknown function (DUF3592)
MMKTGRNRKQWLADGIAVLGLAGALFAVALVVRDVRLSTSAQTTVGTVTEKHLIEGGSEDPDTYSLRYSFVSAAGGEFRGSDSVEFSTYSKAKIGNRMNIEYAADDPENNRIAGNSGMARWWAPFAVLVTGGAWFVVFGISRWLAVGRGEPDPALEW